MGFAIINRAQLLGRGGSTPGGSSDTPDAVERVTGAVPDCEYVLAGRTGVVERRQDGSSERFEAPQDEPVATVVSDRRLVVHVPGSDPRDGPEEFTVPFADVERAGLDEPAAPSQFRLRCADGTRWRIPAADTGAETLGEAARYVQAGADVWSRVDAARSAVLGGRDQVLAPARDDRDWANATDRYQFLRERLRDARERVESSQFSHVDSLTEGLDRADAALERTWARAHCYRVVHAHDRGVARFADGEFEAALSALNTARHSYRRARDHAPSDDTPDVPPVSPGTGDGQVPTDPGAALDVARSRLASLIRHAVGRANVLVETAEDCDEEAARARKLSTAVPLYRGALYCGWTDRTLLPVDRDRLQETVAATVAEAVETHRSVAEAAQERGWWLRAEGDPEADAVLATAMEHFGAAYDLAREFRPGDAEALDDARASIGAAERKLPLGPA